VAVAEVVGVVRSLVEGGVLFKRVVEGVLVVRLEEGGVRFGLVVLVVLFFGVVLVVCLVDIEGCAVFDVVVVLALEKRVGFGVGVGIDACGCGCGCVCVCVCVCGCGCGCAGPCTCASCCSSGVGRVVYVSQGCGIILWMVVVVVDCGDSDGGKVMDCCPMLLLASVSMCRREVSGLWLSFQR